MKNYGLDLIKAKIDSMEKRLFELIYEEERVQEELTRIASDRLYTKNVLSDLQLAKQKLENL